MLSGKDSGKTASIRSEPRSADQVRLELISDRIHDLRTPLVSARGYAKMLLEERVGALNSVQQEYLGIIVQSMNRMIPLLNDLAELASAEPLFFEPLAIEDLWQDSLQLWKSHALIKSVQVLEKVPSESLPIRGDREKLKQVFEELFSRMVRSAEPGAEVILELSCDGGDEMRVSISDRPAANPQKAAIAGATASQSGGGQPELDMGLTVVQQIIRLHGGQFSVTKNDCGGAVFAFTLPV